MWALRRLRAVTLALAACALATGALAGCGGTPSDAVVVRVGRTAITKAEVDHWTSVIERGGGFSGFRGKPGGSAKQRALALLISSSWLIGEAARQGIPVSAEEVDEALQTREEEAGEFHKQLRAEGETITDAKLEMRSELAEEAIISKLAGQADSVTPQEVEAFYRADAIQFGTPETRITDLVENIPSRPAAAKLAARLTAEKRFPKTPYHEQVIRSPGFTRTPDKVKLVDAIFAASPGVISAPMGLNNNWTIFIVRKVLPATPLPLTKVRHEVTIVLRATRQRALKTRFNHEYTTLWQSKTKCFHGYVGPGCPAFKGRLEPYEDPFSLRAHPALAEQGG
jgi:PPIC-type PPIASE domain/SurA N-terminal domain